MLKAFGPAYSVTSVLMFILSVLQFANPLIVNLLIDFVSSDDPDWKGYLYTVLIVLVTFVITILNSQAFYREYLVGLRIRTGLISAIYRKSLRLSNGARKEMTGTDLSSLLLPVHYALKKGKIVFMYIDYHWHFRFFFKFSNYSFF